jgi:hypothetical protein
MSRNEEAVLCCTSGNDAREKPSTDFATPIIIEVVAVVLLLVIAGINGTGGNLFSLLYLLAAILGGQGYHCLPMLP